MCVCVYVTVLSLVVLVHRLPSPSWSFGFVNEPMSWEDARNYCRERHTDLAMPENMEEMNKLQQSLQDRYQKWETQVIRQLQTDLHHKDLN